MAKSAVAIHRFVALAISLIIYIVAWYFALNTNTEGVQLISVLAIVFGSLGWALFLLMYINYALKHAENMTFSEFLNKVI